MFRAIRLRLIAYVVGVLALVLLAAGALVYVLLTRQLDAAVEAQLGAVLPPALALPAPPLPPPGVDGGPTMVSVGAVVAPGALPPPDAETAGVGFVGVFTTPAS